MDELRLADIRKFIKSHSTTLGTFVLLIFATIFGYVEVKERNQENYQNQFVFRSRLAVFSIENRLSNYIQLLRAGRGLYNSSDTISREEWIDFLESFNLQRNYPGVQGIGYAPYVRGSESMDSLVQVLRNSGFPDFQLYPVGNREVYTPIVFIEPFDWRNQRAVGYDMFNEPSRRRAMERARDNNQAALTGKVILVQETNEDVQAGFLIYLPVYHNNSEPTRKKDAASMIQGFVYAPFRATDFAQDIFKDHFEDIDIEIYDGVTPTGSGLLYNKDRRIDYSLNEDKKLHQKTHLTVAGRTWTIYITPKPVFWRTVNLEGPFVFLVSGIVISILLSLIAWSLSRNKKEIELKRTITDNASAGLFLLDHEGVAYQINPAGYAITGYKPSELNRRPLYEYLDPEYISRRAKGEFTRLILNKDKVREAQLQLVTRSGKTIWCSISKTIIQSSGTADSCVVEIRDITSEKKAQQELIESAERFRFLANSMPDKVWTADPEGKITYYNRRWIEFIGIKEKIPGEELWDYIHPDDIGYLREKFNEAIESQTPLQAEYRLRDKKGKYRWQLVKAEPNFNSKGEVEIWIGATIDIDERKLQEESLKKSAKQISAINEELSDFASVVSHDLKAPLRAIGTLTDFLVLDCDYLKGEDKDNLLLIKERVKRMEGLINGILRYSRIGKDAAEYEDIDLNKLVDEVIHYIKPPANFKITTGDLPVVNFVRIQMFQLFQNIIDNAIKYNDKEEGLVNISCKRIREGYEVTIRDNGPGVDPRYSQRIFKMFQTLAPRDKRESTGIGLTIVQKIVKGFSGRIWVESEKGKGTDIKFIIPDSYVVKDIKS